MRKTEFFKNYGGGLVPVRPDDAEYGEYMLLHPEETSLAESYERHGCIVVSVHEMEDGEDDIDTSQPCDYGSQPFKIGYLVLDNPIFALLK
jgi:hypothetical protein